MLQQFRQFKQSMQGRDPKKIIDQLLTSGRMTPQQFQRLKEQAMALQDLLK